MAAMLLYGGGAQALQALQAGAISAGLPFTVILLVCCISLWKGLREDHKALKALDESER